MIRRFLQRLGILRTPEIEESDFLVTVYVMSEGTAQGIARPLQVLKMPLHYSIDVGGMYWISAESEASIEVARILRHGYSHTLADGTNVTYAPHTIYKITSKDITNED